MSEIDSNAHFVFAGIFTNSNLMKKMRRRKCKPAGDLVNLWNHVSCGFG
jgi:hypothetical protein